MCNMFLWEGDLINRSKAKVSLSAVCLPKIKGGLGLRDFWLLFSTSDSLWVAWNHEHRVKQASIWCIETNNSSSWIWKHTLSLRLLAKSLRCDIGDGTPAAFWHDIWLGSPSLYDILDQSGPRLMGIHSQAKVVEACNGNRWRLPSARTRSPHIIELRLKLLSLEPPNS